jgi:hypothetical protein
MARPESINPQLLRPAIIPPSARCLPPLKWRDLGDLHWVMVMMENKVPMAVCNSFISLFTDTGENMNLKPNATREKQETFVEADKLFHLHVAKSRTACALRRAQAHGGLVEPAVMDSC